MLHKFGRCATHTGSEENNEPHQNMNTQYKVTMAKRTQGTWDYDYSSGQLAFTGEHFDDKAEAEATAEKLNNELAQEMADGCGIDVEQWNETRARDCDKYWHVIEV